MGAQAKYLVVKNGAVQNTHDKLEHALGYAAYLAASRPERWVLGRERADGTIEAVHRLVPARVLVERWTSDLGPMSPGPVVASFHCEAAER